MASNWDQFCNLEFYILTIFQGEGKQAAVQRDSTSAGNPPILLSTHLAILHLTLPSNPFMPKPDPSHPFFLTPASSFHFSSLFSGDLGKPGRRRKARTVFSDAQLAGLERRFGK